MLGCFMLWIERFVAAMHWLDRRLTPFAILSATVLVVAVAVASAILVTLMNSSYYLYGFEPCASLQCFKDFHAEFEVQVDMVVVGAQVAGFIALVLGPYIALKSYVSTTNAQVFGNNIAHIGFFERYLSSELEKRQRVRSSSVDTFSLYRLMFPEHGEIYASKKFFDAVSRVVASVNESNHKFQSDEKNFVFATHRASMILALDCVFIRMSNSPRIDFLECEDEVVDLLEVLVRVFCQVEQQLIFPRRAYR